MDNYTGSLGSASISGNTPLGTYDNDSAFQSEGPKIARWIQFTLGHPVVQVELTDQIVYSNLEHATNEYSSLVNTANTRNWLTTYMGTPTSSDISNKYPFQKFSHLRRTMDQVSHYAGVGGDDTLHSGSVPLVYQETNYDLGNYINTSCSGQYIEIQDVWHYAPSAMSRVYDPYFGVFGTEINDAFGYDFGGITAGLPMYYMFPNTSMYLRAQAVELSDRIRRSQYTWKQIGKTIHITPPTKDIESGQKMWFTYYIRTTPIATGAVSDGSVDGIFNISNIPYQEIQYSKLNAQAKQWIRDFTLASCMISLGRVRGKIKSVPIPNNEVSLDGDDLVAQGIEKQNTLRDKLAEELDLLSMEKLMEAEARINESIAEQSRIFPLGIWIG